MGYVSDRPLDWFDPSIEEAVRRQEEGISQEAWRNRPAGAGPIEGPSTGNRRPSPQQEIRDPVLESLRARLQALAQFGFGNDWMREQFYTGTHDFARTAYQRGEQIRQAGESAGFDESGFINKLRESIERRRQEALNTAWEGIRGQNEELKIQASRQLADLNAFYRRMREAGKLDDAEFYFGMRQAENSLRQQREAAKARFVSGLSNILTGALSGYIASGGNPFGALAGGASGATTLFGG